MYRRAVVPSGLPSSSKIIGIWSAGVGLDSELVAVGIFGVKGVEIGIGCCVSLQLEDAISITIK
jgi:hypothetical protein